MPCANPVTLTLNYDEIRKKEDYKGSKGRHKKHRIKGPYVLSGGPLIFTFSFFSQGLSFFY